MSRAAAIATSIILQGLARRDAGAAWSAPYGPVQRNRRGGGPLGYQALSRIRRDGGEDRDGYAVMRDLERLAVADAAQHEGKRVPELLDADPLGHGTACCHAGVGL